MTTPDTIELVDDYGRCELCRRICWARDTDTGQYMHPCCYIEMVIWHEPRCQACIIAEARRERWERRRGAGPGR